MTAYDLPFSVEVGGKSYPIRYGWRAVVDILAACSDPDLDEYSKAEVILTIFYEEPIPPEHLEEALQKANDFIDHGCKQEKQFQKKMMDWQQDETSLSRRSINAQAVKYAWIRTYIGGRCWAGLWQLRRAYFLLFCTSGTSLPREKR
jgi:hypothetical protein